MSLETPYNKRIFGLDFVRALAIVLVLFSHIYYLIDSVNPFLISISGMFGYIGVELFFVLSGFLIGTILLKLYLTNDFSYSSINQFLRRRWFRTLPNYFLVLVLNLLLAIFLDYTIHDWWLYFLFLQNLHNYQITFFSESWSLAIEEWTYFIAPILLFFTHKIFKTNKKIGFLFTVLSLIIFIHFVRYFYFLNHKIFDMNVWNTNLKSIVILRLDVIFFGFIIAWIHHFYEKFLKQYKVYFIIIAVHLFFLQFFVLNVLGYDIVSKPIYFNVFYFTLSSITISLAFPFFIYVNNTKAFLKTPITFLSKISYSVYLLHYSIMSVIVKYLITKISLDLSVTVIVFLYLSITIFSSYLMYQFFEKPIMSLRDKI